LTLLGKVPVTGWLVLIKCALGLAVITLVVLFVIG